jgi:hypothetical protein
MAVKKKECPTCKSTENVRYVETNNFHQDGHLVLVHTFKCEGVSHKTEFCTRIMTRMDEVNDILEQAKKRVDKFKLV